MSNRPVRRLSAVIAVVGLTISACGGDDGSSPEVSTLESEVSVVPTDPADESKEPDVVLPAETPTELVITDLTDGEGDGAVEGDTVFVFYVGVLSSDGKRFDGNFDGEPFAVTLGQGAVIPGWEQGLIGMKVGGRRQLDIPADLAYGEAGSGDAIPPDSCGRHHHADQLTDPHQTDHRPGRTRLRARVTGSLHRVGSRQRAVHLDLAHLTPARMVVHQCRARAQHRERRVGEVTGPVQSLA